MPGSWLEPSSGKNADKDQFNERVKELYAEMIEEQLEMRDLVTLQEIKDELIKISTAWRGPIAGDPGYVQYRLSAPELYADAVSVLVNDPDFAEKHSPKFLRSFFGYLDRKPQFRDIYYEIQEAHAQGSAGEASQTVGSLRQRNASR